MDKQVGRHIIYGQAGRQTYKKNTQRERKSDRQTDRPQIDVHRQKVINNYIINIQNLTLP